MANNYALGQWQRKLNCPLAVAQFARELHDAAGFADGVFVPPETMLKAVRKFAAPGVAKADQKRTKFIDDLTREGGK